MIDVEHAFAGDRRFLALLLLLLLRVALALLLLLLGVALLLLLRALLLLLGLGHPVEVLRRGRTVGRCARLLRLPLLRLDRLHAFGRSGGLLRALVVRGVVLHVHDATLRIEGRRSLVLLSVPAALAAAAAATPAVAPELPPALSFLLLALGLAELAVAGIAAAAVTAAATWLRIARVPRLGGIAAGCLGCSRCGGSLSFSVHP
ncbi:MAG TPA: hypothetical protein VKP68_14670 [Ramlibacter sp.]|nr:hypothetical protein [Ramlibacter sp.]